MDVDFGRDHQTSEALKAKAVALEVEIRRGIHQGQNLSVILGKPMDPKFHEDDQLLEIWDVSSRCSAAMLLGAARAGFGAARVLNDGLPPRMYVAC